MRISLVVLVCVAATYAKSYEVAEKTLENIKLKKTLPAGNEQHPRVARDVSHYLNNYPNPSPVFANAAVNPGYSENLYDVQQQPSAAAQQTSQTTTVEIIEQRIEPLSNLEPPVDELTQFLPYESLRNPYNQESSQPKILEDHFSHSEQSNWNLGYPGENVPAFVTPAVPSEAIQAPTQPTDLEENVSKPEQAIREDIQRLEETPALVPTQDPCEDMQSETQNDDLEEPLANPERSNRDVLHVLENAPTLMPPCKTIQAPKQQEILKENSNNPQLSEQIVPENEPALITHPVEEQGRENNSENNQKVLQPSDVALKPIQQHVAEEISLVSDVALNPSLQYVAKEISPVPDVALNSSRQHVAEEISSLPDVSVNPTPQHVAEDISPVTAFPENAIRLTRDVSHVTLPVDDGLENVESQGAALAAIHVTPQHVAKEIIQRVTLQGHLQRHARDVVHLLESPHNPSAKVEETEPERSEKPAKKPEILKCLDREVLPLPDTKESFQRSTRDVKDLLGSTPNKTTKLEEKEPKETNKLTLNLEYQERSARDVSHVLESHTTLSALNKAPTKGSDEIPIHNKEVVQPFSHVSPTNQEGISENLHNEKPSTEGSILIPLPKLEVVQHASHVSQQNLEVKPEDLNKERPVRDVTHLPESSLKLKDEVSRSSLEYTPLEALNKDSPKRLQRSAEDFSENGPSSLDQIVEDDQYVEKIIVQQMKKPTFGKKTKRSTEISHKRVERSSSQQIESEKSSAEAINKSNISEKDHNSHEAANKRVQRSPCENTKHGESSNDDIPKSSAIDNTQRRLQRSPSEPLRDSLNLPTPDKVNIQELPHIFPTSEFDGDHSRQARSSDDDTTNVPLEIYTQPSEHIEETTREAVREYVKPTLNPHPGLPLTAFAAQRNGLVKVARRTPVVATTASPKGFYKRH